MELHGCLWLRGKESAFSFGDMEIWVRSLGWEDTPSPHPRGGNGNLLRDSCLGNPMDRGASWAAIHGVAKRVTQLSDSTTAATTSQTASDCPKTTKSQERNKQDFLPAGFSSNVALLTLWCQPPEL